MCICTIFDTNVRINVFNIYKNLLVRESGISRSLYSMRNQNLHTDCQKRYQIYYQYTLLINQNLHTESQKKVIKYIFNIHC